MNYLDFHSPARVGKHYLCNLDDAESESANQPTANSDLTKAYAVLPPPSWALRSQALHAAMIYS